MNSTVTLNVTMPEEGDNDPLVSICLREDNLLGAQISYLFYFMFAFSLLGNGLVLLIIYRFEKLTSVTNIFLLNLVVSDLIFVSSLPFWGIYQQKQEWVFSKALCKIIGSTYFLGFNSSVLFLTLMTFDRHVGIVYPLASTQMRRRSYAIGCSTVVWLISCLACIKPMVLYTSFVDFSGRTFCEEMLLNHHEGNTVDHLEKVARYSQVFLFFLFPLAVVVYCYTRITISVTSSMVVAKFRTIRLVFAIVLLFFICWTPYNIVVMMQGHMTECDEIQKWGTALQVTRNIAYLYFSVSPMFYTFVGKTFQDNLRKLITFHHERHLVL